MTLNVALIGYGLAGRVFHAPLIASVEGLHLAAVVSRQADLIHAHYPDTTVLASPDEAFADSAIDLVVVATPNDSHFNLAARALGHGKHVVVDKPFTPTIDEARELIRRAEQAGRVLSVFHNRRWDADFLALKHLIADGTLGEIVYFESHFDRYRPQPLDRWRERAGPATGTWFDLGSHLADQVLHLFGKPLGVYADLANQREGAVTTDYFHVLLRYETLRAVLVGNSLASSSDARLIVHGTRASYIKHGSDPQEAFLRGGGKTGDAQFGVDPRPGLVVYPDGTGKAASFERGDYRIYYAALRDAIAGKGPNPVAADDGLAVMEVLEAGEASAAKRCEIPLPQ